MVIDTERIYNALYKLPKAPEGAEEFLENNCPELFRKNHLIYKSDKPNQSVSCHCTACGTNFVMPYVEASCGCHCGSYSLPKHFGFDNYEFNENVFSKQSTKCPICSEGVYALHISDVGNEYEDFRVQFVKVHIIDRMILVVRWSYCRYLRKNGTYISSMQPLEANIFCKDFQVYATRFMNTYNCYSGFKPLFYISWFINSKFRFISSCKSSFVMPVTEQELFFSDFPNCKLNVFHFNSKNEDEEHLCFLSKYLKIYRKHPNVENLVLNGAVYLLNDIFKNTDTYTGFYEYVNVKELRPSFMLGLNKDEYNTLVLRLNLPAKSISFYAKNKSAFPLPEFIHYEAENSVYDMTKLTNYPYGFLKPLHYLESQEQRLKQPIEITTLIDYWEMMKKCGDEKFSPFPMNIIQAHDKATKRLRRIESAHKDAAYKARFEALKKYSYEYKDLIIFPCSSDEELFREGEQLEHCVYNYSDIYISGRTALLFIRHKDKPKIPFYTLEFDEKNCSILQNHGWKNETQNEKDLAVIEFEKEWLKFAKQVKEKKNGKQRNRSKKSKSACSA